MRLLLAGLLAGMLSACSPLGTLNATVSSGGVAVRSGIPYGDGPRRAMDVYLPPGPETGRPLVVFFYGGSWKHGDRADYRFMGLALAKRGFVAVIPDYRVFPETAFPGFVQDGAAAVAYAAAHAAEFGASGRPFVMGHSAGAYIAMMLALNPFYLAAEGFDRTRLSGAIGLAGPYDFHPADYPDIAPIFAASAEPDTQPIRFADGRAPPLFLAAGDADETVRPYNTINLAAAARLAGGEAETRLYPGAGHIGILLAFAPWFAGKAPASDDVAAFVKATAGPARLPGAPSSESPVGSKARQ